MPGGNDNEINALYAIACSTGEMATGAGGTPVTNYGDNEDSISQAIACNLYATLGALGGTCQPTWVDQATAWQAILQMSVELATLTGTGSAVGFYELPLYGVMCNLGQVAENTGTAAEGVSAGNYLVLLNSIACITAQIAANGFAPPDPLAGFIASLLPFAPDLLIIADSFVGADGDPVASAPDSSGNNNPMFQANASRQPVLAAGPNGRKAYSFIVSGPNPIKSLQCPFPGLTAMASVVVYNSTPGNPLTSRMVSTASGLDGGFAGTNTPLMQFISEGPPDFVGIYWNGFGAQLQFTKVAWQSNACWIAGGDSKMLDQDGNSNTVVGVGNEVADPAVYATIGSDSNAATAWNGYIAFHARWATAPSPANIASFLALVNAYYGL